MITQKSFLNTFKAVETVINAFARMVTNIFTFSITEIAPMVAPLPPAFSIYTAMTERLHVPFYVAVIAAFAIEIIGLFSSKVSIRCYQWNSSKVKSDQHVPQGLSILMTSIFFVVVLLLALTVELIPSLTALVIPGFILISVSTYFNLAIHVNLEKLETDKADDIAAHKIKRGINSEIKQARIDLETVQDDIALAQQTATDSATEAQRLADEAQQTAQQNAQRLADEIATTTTKLEALAAQELNLKSDIAALQKNRKAEKTATSTNAPTATGDDTTELARTILIDIKRNGLTISGAELGRQLGKSGTLGRKLKNELWADIESETETIAQPNGNGVLE